MIDSRQDEDAFPAAPLCLDAGPCSEPAAPMLVLFGGDKKLIRAKHICHWTNCGIMLLECRAAVREKCWMKVDFIPGTKCIECFSFTPRHLNAAPGCSVLSHLHLSTPCLFSHVSLPFPWDRILCVQPPPTATIIPPGPWVGVSIHPSRSTATQLLSSCLPVKPWLRMLRKVSSQ